MIWGGYEPSPPRPGSLDDCNARGFDTDSIKHDRIAPEPLNPEWQNALDRAVEIVKHLRCGVEDCGNRRCDRCDERLMCVGPEPRACGTTCVDCPCSCDTCPMVREEYRAELMHQIEKEDA